jgi:translation initiation factor 2B subunit (eIF-2B alpha/beta/delta family)
MTDQQTHLSNAIEQQKKLITEMQSLDAELTKKRELAIRLQGVIEYLTEIGVTLPELELEEKKSEETDD